MSNKNRQNHTNYNRPQKSSGAINMTPQDIDEMEAAKKTSTFVPEEDNKIVGTEAVGGTTPPSKVEKPEETSTAQEVDTDAPEIINTVAATTDVYLREDPSTKATALMIIKKGMPIGLVSGPIKGWYEVYLNEEKLSGYVMARYTKDLDL